MTTQYDVVNLATILDILSETDCAVFGDDKIQIQGINRYPQEDGKETNFRYVRSLPFYPAKYRIYQKGMLRFLFQLARRQDWRDIVSKNIGHEKPIDLGYIVRTLCGHEVRHRLQDEDSLVLFTSENIEDTLTHLDIKWRPPSYEHLGKKEGPREYDACIVTWAVLIALHARNGELDQATLVKILTSNHETLPDLLT